MADPITVNLGGTYSPGTPQIFYYGMHFSLSASGSTIVFNTVNNDNIYVNLN